MKNDNIIILHQCSVTLDSIVKTDVLAYRQCLFSYYSFMLLLLFKPETFIRLFFRRSVNLNAVSCLNEAIIHNRFRLQQENLTKTEL